VRKGFSIVFVILLLLNVLGYYGVFMGLRIQNDLSMVQRLDSESYGESETVTLKIPVAIPYAMDDIEFKRVDGKIEHEGEFYRLVKQKLSQDTLTIICIKDNKARKISEAFTSYVKTFTDNQSDHSTSKISISLTKDYIAQTFELRNISNGWVMDVVKEGHCVNLIPSYFSSIVHPPERI